MPALFRGAWSESWQTDFSVGSCQDTSENEQDYSDYVVTIDDLGLRLKLKSAVELIFGKKSNKRETNPQVKDKSETRQQSNAQFKTFRMKKKFICTKMQEQVKHIFFYE